MRKTEELLSIDTLIQIPVEKIKRNPENPRIYFRQNELEELTESIRLYGVMVPISVFKEGQSYILIDGERRWLSSKKLNNASIPGLVQEKPTPLTNLLLMFNIHSLREQWDLLTIAVKLPRVISLLTDQSGRRPTEKQLSETTGLGRAVIRRSKLLMEMPDEYKNELLSELNLPKAKQQISEDLFIEMERALKTVERAMPEAISDKDKTRRILIDKYRSGIIQNVVDFRKIPKIASAKKLAADDVKAAQVLSALFEKNEYSVVQAYQDTVSEAYTEKDLIARIRTVLDRLADIDPKQLDEELAIALQKLMVKIQEILRKAR
jgi:ParB family chromosome partitioning protein